MDLSPLEEQQVGDNPPPRLISSKPLVYGMVLPIFLAGILPIVTISGYALTDTRNLILVLLN